MQLSNNFVVRPDGNMGLCQLNLQMAQACWVVSNEVTPTKWLESPN